MLNFFLKIFGRCGKSSEKESDKKSKTSKNKKNRYNNNNNNKNNNNNNNNNNNTPNVSQQSTLITLTKVSGNQNFNYKNVTKPNQNQQPSKTETSREHNYYNTSNQIRTNPNNNKSINNHIDRQNRIITTRNHNKPIQSRINSKNDKSINIDINKLNKEKLDRKSHENINRNKIELQINSQPKVSLKLENSKDSTNKSMNLNRNIENENQYKSDSNETKSINPTSNRNNNNKENNSRIQSEKSIKINKKNNLPNKKIVDNKESFIDSDIIYDDERNRFRNDNNSYIRNKEMTPNYSINKNKSDKINVSNDNKSQEIKTNKNTFVDDQVKNEISSINKNKEKPLKNNTNYISQFRKKKSSNENSYIDSDDERNCIRNDNNSYIKNKEITSNYSPNNYETIDNSVEKINLVKNNKLKLDENSVVDYELKKRSSSMTENIKKPLENNINSSYHVRKKVNYSDENSHIDSDDDRNHLMKYNNENKSIENEKVSSNNSFDYKDKNDTTNEYLNHHHHQSGINEKILENNIGDNYFNHLLNDSAKTISNDEEPCSLVEQYNDINDKRNNNFLHSCDYLSSPSIDDNSDTQDENEESLTNEANNHCELNRNVDPDLFPNNKYTEQNNQEFFNGFNNEDEYFTENGMKITKHDSFSSTSNDNNRVDGNQDDNNRVDGNQDDNNRVDGNQDDNNQVDGNQDDNNRVDGNQDDNNRDNANELNEIDSKRLTYVSTLNHNCDIDDYNREENALQNETDLKRFSYVSTLSSDISFGGKAGIENPKGFCFLNSVIQVIRGCKKFTSAILKYHKYSEIDETQETNYEKIIFTIHFCTLFHKLKNNENFDNQLQGIQNYFTSSSTGDDVNKCFMNLLSVINDVTKKPKPEENPKFESDNKFLSYRNKNYGFVFDCFYGQLLIKMTCNICKLDFNKKFQLFKCLALPVPETKNKDVKLEKCIKIFFKESIVDIDEPMKCNCPDGTTNISSKSQITHCPKYLFIYLDRGSFIVGGVKKNTFIKCSEYISIKTISGNVKYRLISVIDHLGTNESGHYYCKCNYEGDDWWLLNDSQATLMGKCDFGDIITKNTIVFMFKKEFSEKII